MGKHLIEIAHTRENLNNKTRESLRVNYVRFLARSLVALTMRARIGLLKSYTTLYVVCRAVECSRRLCTKAESFIFLFFSIWMAANVSTDVGGLATKYKGP